MIYFHYHEPVFRPPSEANSLIFQATIGCSHNRCTFCGMYKNKRFQLRPVEEVVREINLVPAAHRASIRRVFLADGDALIYPVAGLTEILLALGEAFPQLTRVSCYASPQSLAGKSSEDLAQLRDHKLRLLYFGLESGDPITLEAVNKGYTAQAMLGQCRKARQAGLKLSVTAILGLAGKQRSRQHAQATARWVTELSPEYFSLLTLFSRHNDDFLRGIVPLTQGEMLEEIREMLGHLRPERTILRSNHVSNLLQLAGSYPKDRQRLKNEVDEALTYARQDRDWYDALPGYAESL
ncbi:radical SAM protein [Syntrophotalea acetylenivorans]|uniref:Radical SAM protein n=1 Tax=Syntrophotalea acetylenivorans TaxID=1842532 RepID=A0A1L3GPM9_9BACT|nr:radical SAM protein [Syntrophotalea acetylenivorans]APG27896.1 radical SAM protein [Syntrophotalea acetylenivorans]